MVVKVVNKSKFGLPKYQTSGAAGFDICANIDKPMTLSSKDWELIPSGLYFQVPEGYELQVRPRSGLAFKNGVTVLNTPGTVDSDYTGEVKVILINLSPYDFTVNPGDRIAQGVISPIAQAEFVEVDELDKTERGDGGFGHSGVSNVPEEEV